jgi:UDP-glucuronate decarboxylase
MTVNPVVAEDLARIDAALFTKDRLAGASVLITGCAGFLGFYLVSYLVRHGRSLGVCKIIGLDSFLLERPRWLEALAAEYPDLLEIQKFEIGRDNIADVKGAGDATIVIHGASIASPTFYRQYPLATVDGNIWGLRALLDFYRERKTLRGLLFFSSSEIYGDPEPQFIPTDEEYRGRVSCIGPRACYDESKRFGETLCWIYATHSGMPIAVARPFNNYGPGMRLGDRRLPADFASAIMEGRDLAILSDGTPTRTFCYVADAVAGYLLCVLSGRYDYYNIGTEKPEVSVRELASLFCEAGAEITGYRGTASFAKSPDPDYMTNNPNRRCPNIAKARTKLGYDPQVEVREGVRRYLRYLDHERQHA